MNVQLVEASLEQKPVLHRLMQLYLHDTSEFTGDDVNQEGLFTYRYFDEYWTEPGRVPFLVYCDAAIAGFVLVNTYTVVLAAWHGPVDSRVLYNAQVPSAWSGQAGRLPQPSTNVPRAMGGPRTRQQPRRSAVLASDYRESIPVAFFRK